ncbi:SnoaL-like domain-containing protein [Novosphingobium sp. CF614]|uniref:nuclear transport factor 2 family protein n=1 Tax=Novosphingobium sp. CF614 TaxID=1884364 RepID=UPI0008F122FD|nr:nuclear transport factor 2 family protein [Novosphingobium sp. CF614]SFG49051.1 SnoaL-like domain-containing protein [Novosphingobium sp. CF614]
MSSLQEPFAAQLQCLADIEEIKKLKYRYIRLIDAHRFEEWGNACFTEDCYLSTTDLGTWIGRDNIVAAVKRAYGTAKTIHQVHMPDITIIGPHTATAIWALSDYTSWTANGEHVIEWGRGHYEDSYLRTGQGWRINRTVLVREALPPPSRSALMADQSS